MKSGAWSRRGGWLAAGVLVFLPLGLLLFRSLVVEGALSLENYRSLASARVAGLFLKSGTIAAGAALLAMVLGAALAFFLETRRVPMRSGIRLLALAPLLFPPYMQVAVWRPLLGSAAPGREWAWIPVVVLVLGFSYAPLVFFFASQGIRGISGEILDAARLGPGGEWRAAGGIVLPLAAPAILAGGAMVLVLSFLDQETPALCLVPTYATEIFLNVHRGHGAAFAMAVPILLLLVTLLQMAERWARRRGFAVSGSENPRAPLPASRSSSLAADPLAVAALLAFGGLLVAFPVARLCLLAGSPRRFSEAIGLHGAALLEGIPLGLGAAAGATALAALAAPRHGRPSALESFSAWIPFAVPGTVLAGALIEVYNRPGLDHLYGTRGMLVLAGVVRFFPIAYHALAAHLRSVPAELWEAADLSPLRGLHRLWRAYLPLAAPGLALAGGAVVILAGGEVAAALLLAPPGHRPAPVVISAELHYNVDLEVPAALCLLQAAAVLASVGAVSLLALLARGGPGPQSSPSSRKENTSR